MANISKFLEKIKYAVYGKDMRQSLHDAIKNTNDDLNTFKDTKAQANGLASLGADGKIPDEQMPDLSIVDTFVVPNQATMLALTAQKGDFAVRTDINQLFVLKRNPASNLDNWHNFGIIVLNKSNIGLGNVDNTSDMDKPVSTAQQQAIKTMANDIFSNGGIWNAITHNLQRFVVSERTFYDDADRVFILENDTNSNITSLPINDEVNYILSSTVSRNESRICIVTKEGRKNAGDVEHGEVYVMPQAYYQRYIKGLDVPLSYEVMDISPDGDNGEYIYITLQEDDTEPYDEHSGLCFGCDADGKPSLWIFDDVANPKKMALSSELTQEITARANADSELRNSLTVLQKIFNFDSDITSVTDISNINFPAASEPFGTPMVIYNDTENDASSVTLSNGVVYGFSRAILAGEHRLCYVVRDGDDTDAGFVHVVDYDAGISELSGRLTTAQNAINKLNSGDTVVGSVDKKIKDAITAFAQAITDNNTIDTFQEVLSWISTHGSDFAALVRDVNQNAVDIANLKNGFTYNSDDIEWNFTGDVLNFGDGNGELYLNDGYAVRLNSSDFSGYSTLSAMAEDLTDVKEFVDLWAYDSTNNKYIFDIGTNDLQIGHQGSAPDMYVYYGIQCGSDVNLGRNALDLDSSVYSGYGGLSEMAEDLADLKRNGISNTLSTVEKSQLIAEIKQAVIADINNNIDGWGFDEESSEQ